MPAGPAPTITTYHSSVPVVVGTLPFEVIQRLVLLPGSIALRVQRSQVTPNSLGSEPSALASVWAAQVWEWALERVSREWAPERLAREWSPERLAREWAPERLAGAWAPE